MLVRSRILEILSKPGIIVFDKTGTLTAGRPVILDTQPLSSRLDTTAALQLAATLETASEHVLARAFAAYFNPDGGQPVDVQVLPGYGVAATIAGRKYRIGNAEFVGKLSGTQAIAPPGGLTDTQVWLGDSAELLAVFTIGDELRDDAVEVVEELRSQGYRTIIASGDRGPAVAQVADKLGIAEWLAELTPADKVRLLKDLQSEGATVTMVGDGINDAPVLATADSSIALDSGTALARASADAVSLGRDLGSILRAVNIAKRTQRIIRQNISWAIIYNATAIPLAVSGLLQPWMAAIGMSLSSLLVVFNALRL
jgi:Cu2+-exporting ATPase